MSEQYEYELNAVELPLKGPIPLSTRSQVL